tara:strand:- start:490 stop:945 length:456 start_codon:yes stop_codon:yes gene_type:complete
MDEIENKKANYMWAQLKELGVKELIISFEGSGDDGQIDDIIAEPKTDLRVNFMAYQYETKQSRQRERLDHRIQDWAYDYLDTTCVEDWVNNEGGYGQIKIYDIDTQKLNIEVEITSRYMSEEDNDYQEYRETNFDQFMIEAKQAAKAKENA